MPIPGGTTGPNSTKVYLDDGTGTFPYDISAYVRLKDTATWTRGRPDELQQVSPGSYSLTVDNTDGRFSLGSGTYNIALDQKIRCSINGVTRWTGRVQSWPVSWPYGGQEFSTVVVTAIDGLATAQRRTLRSALEEEILARSPSAYYTLGEAAGATQAADTSASGAQSLIATGTGTAVVFGSGTGPGADGLTAATFAGGQYLTDGSTAVGSLSVVPCAMGCWFNTTGSLGATLVTSRGWSLRIGATGLLVAGVDSLTLVPLVSSASNVNNGATHFAALSFDGTTISLYLDGALAATAVSNAAPGATLVGQGLTGTISHAAVWPSSLSAGSIASIYSAGKSNYSGETPQARVARVAGYAGLAVGTLDTTSAALCGPAVQTGKSAADVFNEVADATLGIVYADKNGAVSSTSGRAIAAKVTPDLTLDAYYADPATVVGADMLQVVNRLTGQAQGSANVTFVANATSITAHGVYDPGSKTWNVSTDAQATDLTNWTVGNYANPDARFPTLVLDLLTLDTATVTTALGLDLGSFLRITGLPSQTPGGTTVDLIVQSVTETVSITEWSLTVTCAKRTRFSGWVLGDATYGVLDSTTRLTAA